MASDAGRSEIVKPQFGRFQDLVHYRVRHILLVSNLYESFILAEDGQLSEAILRQYLDLNLSQNPDVTRASSGSAAVELAQHDDRIDLIITSIQVGDMDAVELVSKVRATGRDIPVVLIAYNNRELTDFAARNDISELDRVFLWQGDVRILIAMVKDVEDRRNVDHDTGVKGVPAIIVVEDNIRFYSSFLPMLYSEVAEHTHGLISEGLNLSQKLLRMRARPKILMCTDYETALGYFDSFNDRILGIISDIEYPMGGQLEPNAGFELARHVRSKSSDVPLVLQSSHPENRDPAHAIGAHFLLKGSPVLLHELRNVLLQSFGFGDFIFHDPDGKLIDRAHDLRTLVEKIQTVPAASLAYHAERNHFSNWLKARTELALAEVLRPRKVEDFRDLEHLRSELIRSISEYRRERDRVVVADFKRDEFDPQEFLATSGIARIGGGSLGGKARGMTFINRLLRQSGLAAEHPDVQLLVPAAMVLGTDVFDRFLKQDNLRSFAIESQSDADVWAKFSGTPFPEEAMADLKEFLREARYPLAVRSSGLLEDSPSQPFAGIYNTYMLPNNDRSLDRRLVQLVAAIKRVYASTFTQGAKEFLAATPYRLEEEKMAVIIQRIVGSTHGQRFYPWFSGVARSYNFYPTAPLKPEDGIVAVALGMGRTVVDGECCVSFCPRYPQHLVSFSSVDDVLRNSQREFYALDLDQEPGRSGAEGAELSKYGLKVAEADGRLAGLASTYSPDNDVIYDGISRPGVRLVNFAPILKHGLFPLADVLNHLLQLGSEGTGSPVEIEFAVNPVEGTSPRYEFGVLQLRPIGLTGNFEDLEMGEVQSSKILVRSSKVLGHGRVSDIQDVVVVDYHRFDRLKSREVALDVARFNGQLQALGRPYLLIGVGRWGSSDPSLGIPVAWHQIAGARIIVEAGFKDFKVTPSQGTHFFQNLTSCNVGYFTVNPQVGEGFIDWDWLDTQDIVEQRPFVRHVRLREPILVKMRGQSSEGVILKSNKRE